MVIYSPVRVARRTESEVIALANGMSVDVSNHLACAALAFQLALALALGCTPSLQQSKAEQARIGWKHALVGFRETSPFLKIVKQGQSQPHSPHHPIKPSASSLGLAILAILV